MIQRRHRGRRLSRKEVDVTSILLLIRNSFLAALCNYSLYQRKTELGNKDVVQDTAEATEAGNRVFNVGLHIQQYENRKYKIRGQASLDPLYKG